MLDRTVGNPKKRARARSLGVVALAACTGLVLSACGSTKDNVASGGDR